jgi:lysozyme
VRVAWLAAALLVVVGLGPALYRSDAVQLNVPDPGTFPVTGIDVSHHQGEVDWARVAEAGVAFAYIKATEGRDFRDKRFEENWSGAAEAGIPRGAYHFFTFCSPGAAQAEHFLRTAPPTPGALPPVADVEFVGNCTSYGDLAHVRAEVEAFVEAVEQAWGVEPILYVTPDSLARVIGDALTAYPVWIRSVFTQPSLDAYRGWALWQFSDNSRIPGIAGPVDRNALRPGLSLAGLTRSARR